MLFVFILLMISAGRSSRRRVVLNLNTTIINHNVWKCFDIMTSWNAYQVNNADVFYIKSFFLSCIIWRPLLLFIVSDATLWGRIGQRKISFGDRRFRCIIVNMCTIRVWKHDFGQLLPQCWTQLLKDRIGILLYYMIWSFRHTILNSTF